MNFHARGFSTRRAGEVKKIAKERNGKWRDAGEGTGSRRVPWRSLRDIFAVRDEFFEICKTGLTWGRKQPISNEANRGKK
ncbi:MAG: hypothetical protein PHV34_12155 [Verrucomicrobiae bacterium]|nr:hypothetical protein [Verrucomicrobiae bacterium]